MSRFFNFIFGAIFKIFLISSLIGGNPDKKYKEVVFPPIVYPYGGTIKLVVGVGMPIAMPGRILISSQNFQFQYFLPQNSTFFSKFPKNGTLRRRRAANDRSIFYQSVEQELQRKGGAGTDCILRAICEYAAAHPLKNEGLVGEILHVLLTPDRADERYKKAANFGKRGKNCLAAYSNCAFGLLDYVSRIV